MVYEPKKAFEVFFSYSHKDQDLRDQLETQLSLLKHQGLISSWHDRKISAGTEWAGEINVHLNTAQIILLLVSSDFLASSYCYDVEVKQAIERHNAGEARVVPVILRYCDWQSSPFGKLQALPTDGKPVTGRDWRNLDEALYDVVLGIRKAIAEFVDKSSKNGNSSSKIGDKQFVAEKVLPSRAKENKSFNPYKVRDEWIDHITSGLVECIERDASLDFYPENLGGDRQVHILHDHKTVYSLNIHKGSMGRGNDEGICFAYTMGTMMTPGSMNAWGRFAWDTDKEQLVLNLQDLSLLSSFHLGDTKGYTKEEFLQALWNRIQSLIKNSSY